MKLLDFYGFYELDRTGTLLFYKGNSCSNTSPGTTFPEKSSFFTETYIPCSEIGRLRFHFDAFVGSPLTTDNFIFSCTAGGEIVKLRISLVRIRDTPRGTRNLLFYMEIKPI